MDIKQVAACGALLLWGPAAFATPPTDMKLMYNVQNHMLHVSAHHPSDRLERHYLRRVAIYKNDEQADEVLFPRQKLAAGMEEDIEFKALPGDMIAVEVFCNQGGSGRAEYKVPKEEAAAPQ